MPAVTVVSTFLSPNPPAGRLGETLGMIGEGISFFSDRPDSLLGWS
jgi:hypothetical protein